jgi:hypothetical protein
MLSCQPGGLVQKSFEKGVRFIVLYDRESTPQQRAGQWLPGDRKSAKKLRKSAISLEIEDIVHFSDFIAMRMRV